MTVGTKIHSKKTPKKVCLCFFDKDADFHPSVVVRLIMHTGDLGRSFKTKMNCYFEVLIIIHT